MLKLVSKDFRLIAGTRMTLIIVGILCVAAAGTLSSNATYAYFASFMTAYMMVNYLNAYDFRYKTEVLFRSLPVRGELIVGSRYVSILAFLTGPIALILLLRLIMCLAGIFPIGELARPEFLVQVFCIGIVYFSIFLPFYYKLGYMKCRWVNFIGMIFVYGVPVAVVKSAEELMKQGAIVRPDGWNETVQEALALFTGTSVMPWNLALILAACLALFVSFRMAGAIYRNRDCAF